MFDTQMRRVKEAKLKIQKPRNMKRCFTERIDSVIPFFISKYSIKTLPIERCISLSNNENEDKLMFSALDME